MDCRCPAVRALVALGNNAVAINDIKSEVVAARPGDRDLLVRQQ